MSIIKRIYADGRLMGAGVYSDVVIVDMGTCIQVCFSGMAALDPATKSVAGYEPHNGSFASDALERQVAYIFEHLELLMTSVQKETGLSMTLEDITRSLVFLREDYPLVFQRFNDAYIAEFAKRSIGVYPARTTVMKVTLPEPNALVEIQFEAVVSK
jgi:enamine deaminase RidA (YjgF/YER057c/UK114 family)